jgi:hypothetical protein
MSLFKIAIVLSLGIAVMPSDQAQQERLYQNAATAAYWTATFCDRNTQTCETASTVWDTFLRKAEFAGKLAYDVAQRYASGEPDGSFSPASFKPGARRSTQGTLSPEDFGPNWRGSAKRQGI